MIVDGASDNEASGDERLWTSHDPTSTSVYSNLLQFIE